MIKYFTADYVLPVSEDPVKNGTVAVNEYGEITGLYQDQSPELTNKPVSKMRGIIVPGFINSHCHLELSHLHNKFDQQQGLVPFIQQVISLRKADDQDIIQAMEKADAQMLENGIVAVGDIANTVLSKPVKSRSKIHYHTYVELLCFEPDKSKDVFTRGLELQKEFAPLGSSIVPHASYSVCKDIFKYLKQINGSVQNATSMHNQETEEENKFYRYKSGKFIEFYEKLKLNIDFFKPQARNSLQSIIPLLSKKQKIMLVHNIYTSLKDIYFVRRFARDISWCFCPNANLYIENRLPKINLFTFQDFNLTIGTDSLASNDKLCLLSELKTLSKHFPSIPLTETISWATLNGARFLGIDKRYGSIEKGKKPGLNLITETNDLELTPLSAVKKLI